MMFSELVEISCFMTGQEFLAGYGLVQGLPGPMFSFASYAGGMAARGGSPAVQFLGAAAGLTAVCLISGKVPAPIIVAVSAAAGIFL